MAVCENRFPLPGSPSTCAIDAGIVPLPSIFLVLFYIAYVVYKIRHPSPSKSVADSAGTILKSWAHWTYVVLAVCSFGMRVLEIVRLALADMGVGLLPVGVIANMVVLLMLTFGGMGFGMGRVRNMHVSLALLVYWVFISIFEAVKVARLDKYNDLHAAKGTDYPSSDWLLDNAVMLGLYIIFVGFEAVHLYLARQEPSDEMNRVRMEQAGKGTSYSHV